MNPRVMDIFNRHYPEGHPARGILLHHVRMVTQKALETALSVIEAGPDLDFIAEAALLHDIGIGKTHAPDIGCHGDQPYICHGVLGRKILEEEGMHRHALVCERHTGTGLSPEAIQQAALPLPLRDMRPQTLEEEIVCYADKFFSKNPTGKKKEKTILEIRKQLQIFGTDQLARFDAWHKRFAPPLPPPQNDASAWREFDLIAKLVSTQKAPGILVGPGDDAALLASLQRPVFSTDTQREGIHFLREWMSHDALGYKAVMAAASDLAASFAQPVAVFVNLGLPQDEKEADVIALQRGMEKALLETGGHIAGGNICRAEALCIDLFFVGEGGPVFPLRSQAKTGEGLYVTGPLGEAAAGCHALFNDKKKAHPRLVEKFCRPRARFDAATCLARSGVICTMDISDGLAGDAFQLARASGQTLHLETEAIPLSSDLVLYCQQHNQTPLHFALTGGEDYELLFTATEEIAQTLLPHLPEIRRIGTCLGPSQGTVTGLPSWAQTGFCHEKT